MAETIELGIVGISNKGEYDAQTSYEKLNVVTYEGSSYCAKQNCKGILPTNSDYWQLYAEKGDKGDKGETGLRGAQGEQGVSGRPGGSPLVANSVSEMTDTDTVYVNTTDGNWYYHNGTTWVSGGLYQSDGISPESIYPDMFSKNLRNDYIFKTRWEVGSLYRGGNHNADNRIRTIKKIYLEKGTILEKLDENIMWSLSSYSTTENSSFIDDIGWQTSQRYIINESNYYRLVMRYNDDRTIGADELEYLPSKLNIFKTSLNYAMRLIDCAMQSNPFSITEKTSNNGLNLKINHNVNFWLRFENYSEFLSRTDWVVDRQISLFPITYDINEYGTAELQSDHAYEVDVTIPNHYALVLDTLTGVVSVKYYAELLRTDGLLIRNAYGYAFTGAIVEINNYWRQSNNENKLNTISDLVPVLSNFINYDKFIKAVNHRGFNTVAPENTLSAYKLSKKNGFNYVETDVSFTSDKVPVLLHDNTIDRTSNGTGNINDLTFAQVRQYDFGSWKSSDYAGEKIPSFEEFILLCRNLGLHPYIELKWSNQTTENDIKGLINIVKKHGLINNVTWISFSTTLLNYVKSNDDKARLGFVIYSFGNNTIADALALKTNNNEVFINCRAADVTLDAVELCVENNIPLETWVSDTESAVLNNNPYVTGITSDNLIAGKVLYDENIN